MCPTAVIIDAPTHQSAALAVARPRGAAPATPGVIRSWVLPGLRFRLANLCAQPEP